MQRKITFQDLRHIKEVQVIELIGNCNVRREELGDGEESSGLGN